MLLYVSGCPNTEISQKCEQKEETKVKLCDKEIQVTKSPEDLPNQKAVHTMPPVQESMPSSIDDKPVAKVEEETSEQVAQSQHRAGDYDFEISGNIIINAKYSDLPVDPECSQLVKRSSSSNQSIDNMSFEVRSLVKIGNGNPESAKDSSEPRLISVIHENQRILEIPGVTPYLCKHCLNVKCVKVIQHTNVGKANVLCAPNITDKANILSIFLKHIATHKIIHQTEVLVLSIRNARDIHTLQGNDRSGIMCTKCLKGKVIRIIQRKLEGGKTETGHVEKTSDRCAVMKNLLKLLLENQSMHSRIHNTSLLLVTIKNKCDSWPAQPIQR